jgi:hypothetical protein
MEGRTVSRPTLLALLFSAVLSVGQFSAAQQPVTSSEKKEIRLHKKWIETTLARMGQNPANRPPADVLLTYAPTSPLNPRDRKDENVQRNWFIHALKKMRQVQVGSTRGKLLKVFLPEGGPTPRMEQTYVDRTCPYIKVDVEFRASDHPGKSKSPTKNLDEDPQDVITKISEPYLSYTIVD